MSQRKATIRIGTSGYQYDHWRGAFYPAKLRKREWFDYYAHQLDSVEINNTFYRLPQTETVRNWHHEAPSGFCYALKFSRYGSHLKRLKDPADSIALFLERAEALKSYLGPILVQLPPNWNVDLQRLREFLACAPGRYRWAIEFRDASWLTDEVFAVLRQHRAALCMHDKIQHHPQEITTNWLYLRFHGPGGDVRQNYSPQFLTATARRLRQFQDDGLDVYAYFNNDFDGYAVHNAMALKRYL